MKLTFTVQGPPVSWRRTYRDAEGKSHNPKVSRTYKTLVANMARLYLPPEWPKDCWYLVGARGVWDDDRARDMDRLYNQVCDALEQAGVLPNDARIVGGEIRRGWTGPPRLDVLVIPVGPRFEPESSLLEGLLPSKKVILP